MHGAGRDDDVGVVWSGIVRQDKSLVRCMKTARDDSLHGESLEMLVSKSSAEIGRGENASCGGNASGTNFLQSTVYFSLFSIRNVKQQFSNSISDPNICKQI